MGTALLVLSISSSLRALALGPSRSLSATKQTQSVMDVKPPSDTSPRNDDTTKDKEKARRGYRAW